MSERDLIGAPVHIGENLVFSSGQYRVAVRNANGLRILTVNGNTKEEAIDRAFALVAAINGNDKARAAVAAWRPIESAPKDGTLLWLLIPATPESPARVVYGHWEPWRDKMGSEYHSNGTYLGEYPTGDGWGCCWMTEEGDYGDIDDEGGGEKNEYGPIAYQVANRPAPPATGGEEG